MFSMEAPKGGRGMRPPFGASLETKFERKKVNEKEIVFHYVVPLLMYGPDYSGDGGRT